MASHKSPKLQLVKTTPVPAGRHAATPSARTPAKPATRAPHPRGKPVAKAAPAKVAPAKVAAKAPAKKPVKAPAKVTAKAAPKATAKTPAKAPVNAPAKVVNKKTAKPAPASQTLRLFQIYYRPDQRAQLDPALEPYNNEGETSPLLEFNVFRKLAASELTKGAALWGALSWKFGQKTGLSGAQLREIIAKNPGYDVYYCNPFPELEGLYHNLWLQGETAHPNFLILCNDFFNAAGLDVSALEELQPSSLFASSNYFVATPAFWQRYLAFMESSIATAEKNMSSTAKAMIYSSAADRRGLHAEASYLPFIIERLFGYFLARHAQGLKAYKYQQLTAEQQLNVHQKLLGQMKDAATQTRSLWLGSCWVNYRNLYMQQSYGSSWVRRYLKSITPPAINFK